MASLTNEEKEVIKDATDNVRVIGIGGAEPIRGEVLSLEVPDFWTKHKNKAWVAILLLVGAVGGNVDELYKAIPDVHDVAGLRKEVVTLRTDVDALKARPSIYRVPAPLPPISELPPPAPEPVDSGFRVERPNK